MGPTKRVWVCVTCRISGYGAKVSACPRCGRLMVAAKQQRRRVAPAGGPPALKAEESDKTVMFDLSRCPQTEDEARAWYFAGIGKAMGGPANDYEAVMTAAGLPPGYGPGVYPTAAMPFFAFTNMVGSSGESRGRIFLPTAQPDANNFYTRQIQVIADGPTPGSLVWAWIYYSGNAYVPVQAADGSAGGGGDTGGGGGDSALEARVTALEESNTAQAESIGELAARVSAVETAMQGPFRAHGPVDLPLVLRSLTSLRALGDIDVAVVPGEAIPPPPQEDVENAGAKLALLIRRLRDRDDGDGDEKPPVPVKPAAVASKAKK